MSDLIKRSDAIKAIEELPNAYNGWSDAYDKAYIIGTLEEVPSAEITADDVLEYCRPRLLAVVAKEALPSADRPQGKWIDIGGYEVCKNCHEVKRFPHWNYCPNCGARMKGADDE